MTLRVIAKNAGWLGLVQLMNYALPLVMVPFVTRALGSGRYGIYALGLSYGAYCSLLVEYGFFFEATRMVAQNRHDLQAISRLHSVVFVGKLLLAVVALLGIAGVFVLTGAELRERIVFTALALSSILCSLAPVWVFVALQRMGEMGAAQIVSRAVFTFAVILLVRSPNDLELIAVLQLLSYLGLALYLLIRLRAIGVGFSLFPWSDLSTMFAQSAKFFLAALSSGAYGASSVIVVRQVASFDVVGHFALADRIRVMLASVVAPFSLAIYPFVSAIGARSATTAERRTKAIATWTMLGLAACVGLLAFFMRHLAVRLLAGPGFREASVFIAFFAATPLLTALNNMLSTQTLIAQGHGREAMSVQVSGAVLGIALSYAMALRAGPVGVCAALLVTDILVVGALFVLCARVKRRRTKAAALFDLRSA